MKTLHLVFGCSLFVLFLITGQLMYYYYPEKLSIDADYRLLMRSRHIYLLFSALIHMLIGAFATRSDGWRAWFQHAGSGFLLLGSGLLIAGFFIEVFEYREFSSISAFGVQATFAGTLGYLFSAKRSKE